MTEKVDDGNLQSFKVVLMGDSGVGKTSIVNRYIKDTFADNIVSTTGVSFFSKILEFPETRERCKLDVIIIII
jgi:GTPase SAR1 family protein